MNIGIIGLGLIGGSIGKATIKKTSHKIFGYDISSDVMYKADMICAINEELNFENCKYLDILFICTNPRSFVSAVSPYLTLLKSGCIVCDCGGNKRNVVKTMKALSNEYSELFFCGLHPMAGREFWGISHATVNLFDKASLLCCPINMGIFELEKLKNYALSLGFASMLVTNPDKHDKMIAYTSQLCHVISNSYVKSKTSLEHYGYSAGSFRDLTRVAKLNTEMWTELFIDNRDNLITEIDTMIKNLQSYRDALNTNDRERLSMLIDEGNEIKIRIEKNKPKTE